MVGTGFLVVLVTVVFGASVDIVCGTGDVVSLSFMIVFVMTVEVALAEIRLSVGGDAYAVVTLGRACVGEVTLYTRAVIGVAWVVGAFVEDGTDDVV